MGLTNNDKGFIHRRLAGMTYYEENIKAKLNNRMPRINSHASALQQDKQLREQLKWLKSHGFNNPREAQDEGY